MSSRNRTEKKLRRLEKMLRLTPPSYINLVEWLLDRRHAATIGEAQRLILDGKVKADSHVIGRRNVPTLGLEGKVTEVPTVMPLVPAALRSRIVVSA